MNKRYIKRDIISVLENTIINGSISSFEINTLVSLINNIIRELKEDEVNFLEKLDLGDNDFDSWIRK